MTISYSTGLLNAFAPHITELTECSVPDMAEYTQVSRTWIHTYVLNSTFGGAPYDEPYSQIALTYMRRTESAFQEYYSARNALSSYISSPREHVSKYFESLHHFELLISLTYQAYMLMRHFLANDQVYVRGDKSELDRIDTMYNFIKHADEKLNKRQFPKKYSSHVWLTNSGVSCKKATILFSELADALKDMANGAKRFGNPIAFLMENNAPGTFRVKSCDLTFSIPSDIFRSWEPLGSSLAT